MMLLRNNTGEKTMEQHFSSTENFQPTVIHPIRVSSSDKRKIKTFSDLKKLKEFITSRPILQEMVNVEESWEVAFRPFSLDNIILLSSPSSDTFPTGYLSLH